MMELIRELIRFLSQDPLAVDEVTARIGPIVRDPGIPMPIELRPALAGVCSAYLTRYPESGLPYVLTVEPTRDAAPTVGALQAVFGDYRRALTGRGMPYEIVFSTPAEGTNWRIVLIARLEPVSDQIESTLVTSIALRRDPT